MDGCVGSGWGRCRLTGVQLWWAGTRTWPERGASLCGRQCLAVRGGVAYYLGGVTERSWCRSWWWAPGGSEGSVVSGRPAVVGWLCLQVGDTDAEVVGGGGLGALACASLGDRGDSAFAEMCVDPRGHMATGPLWARAVSVVRAAGLKVGTRAGGGKGASVACSSIARVVAGRHAHGGGDARVTGGGRH